MKRFIRIAIASLIISALAMPTELYAAAIPEPQSNFSHGRGGNPGNRQPQQRPENKRPAMNPNYRPKRTNVPAASFDAKRTDRTNFRPVKPAENFRPGNSSNRPNSNRPSNNNRPNNNNRPSGNRPSNNRPNFRPGNSDNDFRPNSNRPSNNRPSGNRPSNNRPSGNRPGYRPGDHGGNFRPDYGRPNHGQPSHGRPVNPNPGGYKPGIPGWGMGHIARPVPPPRRPYRPRPRPIYRPPIPPSYVPYRNAPILGSILGLTFGITINNTISALVSSGYAVDGYANREVYLRDVNELDYIWPDAILYYDTRGCLSNMSFYYSTTGYDMARYNNIYSQLCYTYGAPATRNSAGGGISASWYDRDARHFITLTYDQQPSYGGFYRFFTSLTYGYN